MRFLNGLLFTLALVVSVSAQIDTNSQHYYMYMYFIQSDVGQKLGARIAFSTDGTTWEKYNDEKPVIAPAPHMADGEDPLMRDPNPYYDSTTGVFHLVWTTAWNQDNIGYATSSDLINWSNQVMIPVGERITGWKVCWAPEIFYDDIKDSLMIYWSTDRGTNSKEAFCSFTNDFKHFTEPKVYFSPKNENGEGYNVIDESIIKVADGKYYMFFKDERKNGDKQVQNIHYVFGPTPQGPWWKGPWDDVSEPLTFPGFEGPTACKIGDEVRVYYDPFNLHSNTKRSSTAKIAAMLGSEPPTWTPGAVMKITSADPTLNGTPFLPSHGSVSEVPRAKVMQVLYGQEDKTVYAKSWTPIKSSQIYFGNDPKPIDTDTNTVSVEDKVYPRGKRNTGCGTGFGLAFIPPVFIMVMSRRKRKKKQ